MKALVTGSSGFLGHALVRTLVDADVEVIAAVGPVQHELEHQRISDLKRWRVRVLPIDLSRDLPVAELSDTDWDTLFHLAAYVRTEEERPEVRINDLGTARLFEQLRLANKRVVYTSSIAVADNAPSGNVTLEADCRPRTAYGATKLAGEVVVQRACRLHNAPYTIIRLPTLYGAGYRAGGMFDVLPKKLSMSDRLAQLEWPGRLALLAVEDAATLLYRTALAPTTHNRTFLASSNENPQTWEIASAIAAATGADYRPIRLSKISVRAMRGVLGSWWQFRGLPYPVRIAAWRARLLLDGLYCDGTELTELLDLTYQDWRQGVERMYLESAERLRHAGIRRKTTSDR